MRVNGLPRLLSVQFQPGLLFQRRGEHGAVGEDFSRAGSRNRDQEV